MSLYFTLQKLSKSQISISFASGISFNPKTVKSQIQGGIYSVKTLLLIQLCDWERSNEKEKKTKKISSERTPTHPLVKLRFVLFHFTKNTQVSEATFEISFVFSKKMFMIPCQMVQKLLWKTPTQFFLFSSFFFIEPFPNLVLLLCLVAEFPISNHQLNLQ